MIYYRVERNADLSVLFGKTNKIKRNNSVVFLQSLCLFSVIRFCFFFIDRVLAVYTLKARDSTSL